MLFNSTKNFWELNQVCEIDSEEAENWFLSLLKMLDQFVQIVEKAENKYDVYSYIGTTYCYLSFLIGHNDIDLLYKAKYFLKESRAKGKIDELNTTWLAEAISILGMYEFAEDTQNKELSHLEVWKRHAQRLTEQIDIYEAHPKSSKQNLKRIEAAKEYRNQIIKVINKFETFNIKF